MYFQNYRLPKTWLDQRLKSSVLEDPFKNNMVNAPKHCSNMTNTSFTIFIDYSEGECLTKSLAQLYAKYQDCFLTH